MFKSKLPFRIGTIAVILMLAFGSVQPALAASNDYFAEATTITSLPFSATTDMYSATYEVGEPVPDCGYGSQPNSVWFAYTPSANVSLTAYSDHFYSILAVYTGPAVDSLTQISCGTEFPLITIQAQAEVTYYFQLSQLYPWYGEYVPFSLEVTPPPDVSINYSPYDPSVFDNVFFHAGIYDPGRVYGDIYAWNFGDGTISNEPALYHQYKVDGDYAVSLMFTTYDGRTNTANTTLQVRTRDIAITKFGLPQTARTNQTKEITVEVTNKRYSGEVQVQLYKGLPGGGEQLIGTLTNYVPARAKRPTLFKFSYTFTPYDARIRKVTFRAVATLVNGVDALPADNVAIGTTLVSGPTSYP